MYRFDQGNLQNVPDYGSDMERDNARLEIEMRRLQASNAYNESSQQKRAQMEAQLIAMKEGYLPAGMAQNLIGVPEYNGQQAQLEQQQDGSMLPGMLGGVAGGLYGAFGNAGKTAASTAIGNLGTKVGGMYAGNGIGGVLNKAGTKVEENLFKKNIARGLKNGYVEKDIFGSILSKGQSAGKATRILGKNLVGKGSGKAVGSVLGKLAGGVASKGIAGAAIGGLPGFLVGTAIGAVIEGLMGGDEKDQAKAQFMLSQYQ